MSLLTLKPEGKEKFVPEKLKSKPYLLAIQSNNLRLSKRKNILNVRIKTN